MPADAGGEGKNAAIGVVADADRVGSPALFTLASAAARSGVSLEEVRDGLRSVGPNAFLSVDDPLKQVRLFARDVMRKESTGDLPFPPEGEGFRRVVAPVRRVYDVVS